VRAGSYLPWCALAAGLALLQGCASPPAPEQPVTLPPDDPPAPQIVVLPPEPTPWELTQRERAESLTRQGQLAEAALVWEVLKTIRPQVSDYRNRWQALQVQIGQAVAERLQQADAANGRGQLDVATRGYLSALALQPTNARAAEGLRSIERERNKRNHLGKLTRHTLTRRAMAEAEMPPAAATPAAPAASAVKR
jgi:hypothetical protein